jgi:hypothetical protein
VKHVAIIAVIASTLVAAGCAVRSERVVERPVAPAERTVVYTDTAVPTATTTVYTTR